MVRHVDLDPNPSEQKHEGENLSVSCEDNILTLEGFAAWINTDILIGGNANKNGDASQGEHELPEELEETDKDDSLGSNEEVSSGIDDGNALLEFAPVAVHHAVEQGPKYKERGATDEVCGPSIVISSKSLVDKQGSTANENELDEKDGHVGDRSWEDAHGIHVHKRVNHSKN